MAVMSIRIKDEERKLLKAPAALEGRTFGADTSGDFQSHWEPTGFSR